MRFSENRVIAWIVLAVCVIGSVVGLGGAGMARERNEAVEVYFEGTDDRDSAHCMQAYVDRDSVLCGGLHAPSDQTLERYKAVLAPFVADMRIRGQN